MVLGRNQDRDRGPIVGHDGVEDRTSGPVGPVWLDDRTGQPPTAERLLDGSPSRLETVGFGMTARGRRAGKDSPVIKELRKVANPPGSFRGAQPEVMIL